MLNADLLRAKMSKAEEINQSVQQQVMPSGSYYLSWKKCGEPGKTRQIGVETIFVGKESSQSALVIASPRHDCKIVAFLVWDNVFFYV